MKGLKIHKFIYSLFVRVVSLECHGRKLMRSILFSCPHPPDSLLHFFCSFSSILILWELLYICYIICCKKTIEFLSLLDKISCCTTSGGWYQGISILFDNYSLSQFNTNQKQHVRSTLFTHLLFVYVFLLFTTVGTLFWAAFSMGCYHKFYNKQLGKVIIL